MSGGVIVGETRRVGDDTALVRVKLAERVGSHWEGTVSNEDRYIYKLKGLLVNRLL